ncbi:helicase-like transcription factor CHR27 isoform X2 [Malania oleifera]|uniref:helicase-like transcription factor CHR27 isoform X2 n=1 Tax=Malania oleifera TaxID=397392 RepID=UPI0025AE24DF|nr:helicase-like transcription factor CHR27 isoform X2 [Malania oleifera]
MRRRRQRGAPKPAPADKKRRACRAGGSSDEDGNLSGEELLAEHVENDNRDEGSVSLQTHSKPIEPENKATVEEQVFTNCDKVPSKKGKKPNKRQPRQKLQWQIWGEEFDRFLNEWGTKNDVSDDQNEEAAEFSEAPPELLVPLLRYQKEWLAWALKQEESACKGGILADEMGMGKTIEAIALVLKKQGIPKLTEVAPSTLTCKSSSFKTGLPEIKCTLVICPTTAVNHWTDEIARCTTEGSIKVLVYHGANKRRLIHKFSEYDFVLTTYATAAADFKESGLLARCKFCESGRLYALDKLNFHLTYYSHRGHPLAEIEKEKERLKKLLQKYSKRGTESADIGDEISDVNGVGENGAGCKIEEQHMQEKKEVTGSSRSSPAGNDQCQPSKKLLHSVKWERIILDEAHFIKDKQSISAKAIFALESSYKWALSGSPLQNNLEELYSLILFLQVLPFSYYFCDFCECKSLHYTHVGQCPCSHGRHFCWFNRVVLRQDVLDVKEGDYYKTLREQSQSEFNTYVEAGTVMENYCHIYQLVTRLRQALDHPYLVVYHKTAAWQTGYQDCGICNESAENQVVTSCQHIFCRACLLNFYELMGKASCPSCSTPLSVDFITKMNSENCCTKSANKVSKSSILDSIYLEDFQTSTKIDALKEEIRFMMEMDGSAKAIVFSQFTSFLDLVNYSLQKSGINCVKLQGSMTVAARDAAVKRFNADPDCKIFLLSLKAGGVALNLTVASNVFLMEPWWNSSVERQAFDRIHRIGQYKPIRIVRFIIKNSVEERILKLQEKKETAVEGALSGSLNFLGKLSVGDLAELFSMAGVIS